MARASYDISTGIRFFDHMLELFARHGAFRSQAALRPAISMSTSITRWRTSASHSDRLSRKALGNKVRNSACRIFRDADGRNIGGRSDRSRVARSAFAVDTKVRVRLVGDLQTELVDDFFEAFSRGALANVHIKVMYGRSNHHKIEASFKAFATGVALRMLERQTPGACAAEHERAAVIAILDYGAGNLTSVVKAFRYIGAERSGNRGPDSRQVGKGRSAPGRRALFCHLGH